MAATQRALLDTPAALRAAPSTGAVWAAPGSADQPCRTPRWGSAPPASQPSLTSPFFSCRAACAIRWVFSMSANRT